MSRTNYVTECLLMEDKKAEAAKSKVWEGGLWQQEEKKKKKIWSQRGENFWPLPHLRRERKIFAPHLIGLF